MYSDYAANRLWLASDDASAWSPAGGTTAVANSQCSFPVTFAHTPAGVKTIFKRAVNRQGGDTGY